MPAVTLALIVGATVGVSLHSSGVSAAAERPPNPLHKSGKNAHRSPVKAAQTSRSRPATSSRAARAPEPVAEPPSELPFAFVGQWITGDQRTAFLVTDGRLFVVHVGDVVEGKYRIEGIDDVGVDFLRVSSNIRQRVPLGAGGMMGSAPDAPPVAGAEPRQGADTSAELEAQRERTGESVPVAPPAAVALTARQGAPVSAGAIAPALAPNAQPPAPGAGPQPESDTLQERQALRERPADSVPNDPSMCPAVYASNLKTCDSVELDAEAAAVCRQAADQTYRGCVRTALRAATPPAENP